MCECLSKNTQTIKQSNNQTFHIHYLLCQGIAVGVGHAESETVMTAMGIGDTQSFRAVGIIIHPTNTLGYRLHTLYG